MLPDPHDSSIARLRRLSSERTALSAKRQSKLEELEREREEMEAQLGGQDEIDEDDPRYTRLDQIAAEVAKIQRSRKEQYNAA